MSKVRKEVHLTPEIVSSIQKKAESDKRSFKLYLEIFIEALANDKVIIVKKP